MVVLFFFVSKKYSFFLFLFYQKEKINKKIKHKSNVT